MKKTFISLFLSLFITTAIHAQTPSVDEIVSKTNLAAYYAGKDGRANVRMSIFDKQGRKRNREMIILRQDVDDGQDQNYYIYFKKPSDVRKMSYLVWKHTGKDDDRWMYLPALDLVKRIASSDKRTSFAGSHFFYEDLSGRNIDEDDHELIETNDRFFILKNTPRKAENVEFSYFNMHIDREKYIPVKVEFFDKKGKLYRVYEALEVEEIQGYPTPVKTKMTDLKSGGHTIIEFSNITYDIGLEDKIFTERYLRNAPRELVR